MENYLIVIVTAGVLLATLVVSTHQQKGATIKIGVIQSLSGIAAEDGKTVVNSLKLAADEINKRTHGRLKLIIEDDASSPTGAVKAFYRLKASGVNAIIGATWDFTTNAIIPLAKRYKLPLLNTSTLPEALKSSGNTYVFNNAISVTDEARPFKEYLKRYNSQKAAILYAGNPWGEIQLKEYSKIIKENGKKLVDKIRTGSFENNEWRSVILRLKKKQVNLVVLLLNKDDIKLVLRRAKELKFSPQFFASKNAYDAFYATPDKSLFSGLCFTYPLRSIGGSNNFVKKYTAKYAERPRIYADTSYQVLKRLFTNLSSGSSLHIKKSSSSSDLVCVKQSLLELGYKFRR